MHHKDVPGAAAVLPPIIFADGKDEAIPRSAVFPRRFIGAISAIKPGRIQLLIRYQPPAVTAVQVVDYGDHNNHHLIRGWVASSAYLQRSRTNKSGTRMKKRATDAGRKGRSLMISAAWAGCYQKARYACG